MIIDEYLIRDHLRVMRSCNIIVVQRQGKVNLKGLQRHSRQLAGE